MPTPTANEDNNGHPHEPPPPTDFSPIVLGRPGRPSFSLEALRERVERQFHDETAHRGDILSDLDTEDKRREALRDVLDYVLAVEAITLSARDKRAVIDRAYQVLFSFGPLDGFLRDDTITEISVSGPHTIHVRRGMGMLTPIQAAFEDRIHLENVIERVLPTGGAGSPFVETGVMLEGRRARLSLIAPPVSPDYSLTIRLHPRAPVTLDDLQTRFHAVSPEAAALLREILAAGRGLLIVGEAGTGKTTLAGALALELPAGTPIHAIERAAEMSLPDQAVRCAPVLSAPDSTFAGEILRALDDRPDWLIVDEIRGDEAAAVHAALLRDDGPPYLWVFRGDSQPDRLRSALSMVIRKHAPAIDQVAIHQAIARHLPIVAVIQRVGGEPRLHRIAEWVASDESLALRPLLNA